MSSPDHPPTPTTASNGTSPDAHSDPLAAIRPDDPAAVTPAASGRSPMPFEGLVAPDPIPAEPPVAARWLAFSSILLGGLLGGLIGYGTGDLMGGSPTWAAIGLVVGALSGALGVGVVAALTLRAMNEWHAIKHPEAEAKADAKGFELRPGLGRRSGRQMSRKSEESEESGEPDTP